MLETIAEVAAVAVFFMWVSAYAYVVVNMGEIRELIDKSEQATKHKVSF
jgi:hypothetical protein